MLQIQKIKYLEKVVKKGNGACIFVPCSFAGKKITIEILDKDDKPIQTIVTVLKRQYGTACFQYVPRKLLDQEVNVVISIMGIE